MLVKCTSSRDIYIGEAVNRGTAWDAAYGPLMDVDGAPSVAVRITNPLFDENYYTFYDNDKIAITDYISFPKTVGVIDVPEDAKYMSMRIGYASAVVDTVYEVNVCVVKGNKVPTDWIPSSDDISNEISLKVSSTDYNGNTLASMLNMTDTTVQISASKIDLIGAVTAECIAAGAVTAAKIETGAITADKIAAGAVTADKISVTDLKALNAKIGGFTFANGSASDKTSANGGHAYSNSLYGHSSDADYEYEVGMKSDGGTSATLAFYVKRIAKGATWANPTNICYLNTYGKLYAQNAEIAGKITATSGKIGCLTTTSASLYTGSKSSKTSANNGIFISADGLFLGAYNSTYGYSAFQVTNTGQTTVHNIRVQGGLSMGIEGNTASFFTALSVPSASTLYVGSGFNRLDLKAGTCYTSSGEVITSDRRAKHDIMNVSEQMISCIDLFDVRSFRYNNGTSGRRHFGVVAQEVEDAVIANGMKLQDFAAVTIDEEGVYGIRYEELSMLHLAHYKRFKVEVERRIAKLENEIQLLKGA